MKIIVQNVEIDGQETQTIVCSNDGADPEAVLESHGHDPDVADYDVQY